MLFPFNSYFDPEINKLITSRAGDNLGVSKLMPWMRVSSSSGLVIETLPKSDSFEARYGSTEKSGRVGTDLSGNSIFITPDRGFRPSPVIESLGVSFGGDLGRYRKSTFNIKCFTLKQAEKVAEHFLEPGYTVLVEYGWNLSKSYAEKINLDECSIARFNTYTHVKEKQKRSGYTYDGFLGYITGGGFNTGDDETYILNVELTSIGEIPAYLQQHRSGGKLDDKQNSGGERFDTRVIESTADSDVGKALFYQMYNRLPPTKRNDAVKKLITEVDSRNIPFISEANFINMDDEIRKDLVNDLQNTAVNQQNDVETSENKGEASVPDGPPLVSESSYIRLELAFEILNRLSYDTKSIPEVCEDVPSFPLAIEYRNTICRGHKHMFSTDGSKLIIPNSNTPDFGLAQALSATTIQEIGPIINPKDGTLKKVVNLEQKDPQDKVFRFPETSDLPASEFPIDAAPFNAKSGEWGYLKDLYVNFEFFIEVLNKPTYVAKDIYYEILNGISFAANAIWHFDIVQIPSRREENKGNYQLEIVDLNFSGKVGTDGITKFFASGVDSPFLESSFGFDIPAAMKNMIVAERTEGKKVDSAPEGNLPNSTLFATKADPVLEKLINFQKSLVEQDTETQSGGVETSLPAEEEKEARKQNYELFMKFATVIPTIKDRNTNRQVAKDAFYNFFKGIGDILASITGFFGFGTDADTAENPTLEQIVAVGAWSDTSLFRRLDLNAQDKNTTPNNILQQITFDFKIHGVSGIKTGDLFEIQDLPSQFKDRAAFTVVEISHSLDGTLWTTSVTGKMKLK